MPELEEVEDSDDDDEEEICLAAEEFDLRKNDLCFE